MALPPPQASQQTAGDSGGESASEQAEGTATPRAKMPSAVDRARALLGHAGEITPESIRSLDTKTRKDLFAAMGQVHKANPKLKESYQSVKRLP